MHKDSLLIPKSLRVIKALPLDWMVTQTFDRLGKDVCVTAWGRTRDEALINFRREVEYAESAREFDLLQDICGMLWDVAGLVDRVIKALRDAMQFFYDHSYY